MTLMCAERLAINKKYIKVWDAIELILYNHPEDDYHDIATYLGNRKIGEKLQLWFIDDFLNLSLVAENNSPVLEAFLSLIDNFELDANGKLVRPNRSDVIRKLRGYYWARSEFFKIDPIKTLDLPEDYNWLNSTDTNNVVPVSSKNNIEVLAVTSADMNYCKQERDQYKQQAEQLRTENEALKQRIAELENTQKHTKRIGVSPEKLNAKLAAATLAEYLWRQDKNQIIKIKDMAINVYTELYQTEHQSQLPDNKDSLKDWIKDVAPSYARESGRPPKK